MCVHTPVECEDGNVCNGIQVCNEATGQCVLDEPAIDCNDGNACTIDTCVTSTGVCEYTDKTCNDGNQCTLNDSCDVFEGCVFQDFEPNCCGNAQCDSNESAVSCPQDCGDKLSTSMDPNEASRGHLVRYVVSCVVNFMILPWAKISLVLHSAIHCSISGSHV